MLPLISGSCSFVSVTSSAPPVLPAGWLASAANRKRPWIRVHVPPNKVCGFDADAEMYTAPTG